MRKGRGLQRPSPTARLRGDTGPRIYETLRQAIVTGELAPGARVVEAELSDRLSVSRTPIRTALHRLEQDGFVVRPGGERETRLVVAPVSQDDAYELFCVIGQLEALCARWAAEREPDVRRVLAERLRTINTAIARAGDAKPTRPGELFQLDIDFHRAYVDSGAGPRVLAQYDAVKPHAERYERLYRSLVTDIRSSVAEHEAIIDHIERGRADGAERAVERNWRNAAVRLCRVIASRGERGMSSAYWRRYAPAAAHGR